MMARVGGSDFVPIVAEERALLPVSVGEDAVGPTAKCTAKTASARIIEIKLAGVVWCVSG
jgi:hypothetical protein